MTGFEAEVERTLGRHGVPGCAVACWDRGERRVWCFGRRRIDPPAPVTPSTRFHLFSGTKLYTATALMLLVDRGALDLDAPVTGYLPELRLSRPVTSRQLASHSSGLPRTLRGFLAAHFPGDRPPTSREALSRYRLEGGRAPGRVRYRNVNYALLGELISRVSGRPYVDFVRDEVLEPLGAAAQYSWEPEGLAQAATGYQPRLSPMRLVLRLLLPRIAPRLYGRPSGTLVALRPFELDSAAIGGLIGNAEAFLPLLGEMLVEGDGLLTAGSKRAMLTLQAVGRAGVLSRDGVGLAWKRGPRFWNHEGGGPGFCSETRIYPERGLGVVVLMNRTQSARLSRVAHAIGERLRNE